MKQSKLKIAVTGGIGSGKSAVMRILAEEGYRTFSADAIARTIYEDAALRQKVAEQFPGCLDVRGEVDRRALAAIVFGDKEKIAALNALTHPYIMQKLFAEMDACDAPAFAEVPLLFESGTAQLFDRVIVVMRDLPARIRAVCERDGIGEREALLRVQSQFDYENNSLNGHTVVYNNGTPEQLRSRVVQVVHEILC